MTTFSNKSTNINNENKSLQNFDIWNERKKDLSQKNKDCFPGRREVWFVNLGKNVGSEINGKTKEFWRPVLVLKKLSHNALLVIPLTTQNRGGIFCEEINNNSFVLFDQIKVLDRKRFIYKMYKMNFVNFEALRDKCKKYLFGEVSFVEPANAGNV